MSEYAPCQDCEHSGKRNQDEPCCTCYMNPPFDGFVSRGNAKVIPLEPLRLLGLRESTLQKLQRFVCRSKGYECGNCVHRFGDKTCRFECIDGDDDA